MEIIFVTRALSQFPFFAKISNDYGMEYLFNIIKDLQLITYFDNDLVLEVDQNPKFIYTLMKGKINVES